MFENMELMEHAFGELVGNEETWEIMAVAYEMCGVHMADCVLRVGDGYMRQTWSCNPRDKGGVEYADEAAQEQARMLLAYAGERGTWPGWTPFRGERVDAAN